MEHKHTFDKRMVQGTPEFGSQARCLDCGKLVNLREHLRPDLPKLSRVEDDGRGKQFVIKMATDRGVTYCQDCDGFYPDKSHFKTEAHVAVKMSTSCG
jgi:hypothetical protein